MKPSIGRIVHYTLTDADAEAINRRRADTMRNIDEHRQRADGSQVHFGNSVEAGDVFPMVIIRVWNEIGTVNGQVLLDGNDTYWASSRMPGDTQGTYRWPERTV